MSAKQNTDMDTPQATLRHSVQDAFIKVLMKVAARNIVLSDMYVRISEDDEPSLIIYDDADSVLLTAPLNCWSEWREAFDEPEYLPELITLLTETVNAPELYELFDNFEYDAPFSLLLVDEKMEIVSELLTIDHENIVLGDSFWEQMDKELDEFFEKLMSDTRSK